MDLSQLRHDLRTPLNQMLGYSEMLLEDAQDQPEVAQELQEILDGSKRLLSLVSKVLAVDGVSLDLIRALTPATFGTHVRLYSVGTKSLAALKAFLQGEPTSARPSGMTFFMNRMLRETHHTAGW